MKKAVLSLFVALMATVAVQAQQISVVAEDGTTTTLYHTLQEAIEGASPNSVIYLPGGGFAISDDVTINKKLTIIGIGYDAKNDNVDGITTISGNLFFEEGSNGSAVMGCYFTGGVYIAYNSKDTAVNGVWVKYCNVSVIGVYNQNCSGTVIEQNYIRDWISCSRSEVTICNNIVPRILWAGSGIVSNNIFTFEGRSGYYSDSPTLSNIDNTTIKNNIFRSGLIHTGSNCPTSNNLVVGGDSWGDAPVEITVTAEDLFVDYNNWEVSTNSDFHFKEAYKNYESKVGIYAGTGFSKKGMAPVPYIVAKQVAEQTDASGNLNIKIRVSAGE